MLRFATKLSALIASLAMISTANGQLSTEFKLTASDGASFDIFGESVAISGDTAVIGARQDDDAGNDSGSVYVFARSGTMWAEQQKLNASDAAAGDGFGQSVAVSGNTVIVGARFDDDSGADSGSAYVFVRTGTTWSEQAKLVASDGEAGDWFGISVALDGNTAIIGSWDDDAGNRSGSAYVFVRAGTNWTEQQKLTASDAFSDDEFGESVAVNGDTALVGAREEDPSGPGSGSAYVFVRTGTSWSEQQKLVAGNGSAFDRFGQSVALSGDTALVGSDRTDGAGSESGSAYVFVRTGTSWTQQQELTASDAAEGDNFGWFVALSGGMAVVGSPNNDDAGTRSGSAYFFTRSGTTWTEEQKLAASDAAEDDQFGYAVALSDGRAVVGAWFDDDAGEASGSAYVYTRPLGSSEFKLTASDAAAGDRFGSVSINGDTVLVGAPFDDDAGGESGSAYVFVRSGSTWSQQDKLAASDAAANDWFGLSVAVSEDTALVGAHLDDDGGSAYVFVRTGTTWAQQQKLTASDAEAGDAFGETVALRGDTALIGAAGDDEGGLFNTGAAYVFVRTGTTWTEQQKLTAPDAEASDRFGNAVAVSGDTALVGVRVDDDAGNGSGSAHVFVRSGTTWSHQQKLTASDAAAGDHFGASVALDGDTALVGAIGDDDVSGSAYAFVRSGSTWSQQQRLTASDAVSGDRFGGSVALDGDIAIAGAETKNGPGLGNGAAYVFVRADTTWSQEQKVTASDTASSDQFGQSVGLSGDTVVVGADLDDDAGDKSGSAYVYDRFPGSFSTFGTGCPGTVGVATLGAAPSHVPWIGQTFELELSGMPAGVFNAPFGVLGLSKTDWDPVSLPLDLSPVGMLDCALYVSIRASFPLVNDGGTAIWEIPVPLDPGLIGLPFYVQGAIVDFGANLSGVIVTNAGEGILGGW